MESKICTKCKLLLPLTEFSWDRSTKDGLNRWCRQCSSTYQYARNLHRSLHPKAIRVIEKTCSRCNLTLSPENFYENPTAPDGLTQYCKKCGRDRINAANHSAGKTRPLQDAKDSSSYLGVYVAERALSRIFNTIVRMPYGNPAFDFICGKGYKIDVKSACQNTSKRWAFHINKNELADFFLCLAFDNRDSLTPLHLWLLPGSVVNHLVGASISESTFAKWSAFEMPMDKVVACCLTLREADTEAATDQKDDIP